MSGHRMGSVTPENKADYWNIAAFQHRITHHPKAQHENIISCFWLLLYLLCAAPQLGLFHWVPSDDDGVPRAKFKSLMVPMPVCLHLHKGVCVCECVCPHIYYIFDIKILILHVKCLRSGAILMGSTMLRTV